MLEISRSGKNQATVRLTDGRRYGLSLSGSKELIVTGQTGHVVQGGETESTVVRALRNFVISDALKGASHKDIAPLVKSAGLFNKPRADFAYVAHWADDSDIERHCDEPFYVRSRVGRNAVIVTARRSHGMHTVGDKTRLHYGVMRYAYDSERKIALTLKTDESHDGASEIGRQCKKAYERLVADTMTFGGRARYAYSAK